jgi:hypothetical protein
MPGPLFTLTLCSDSGFFQYSGNFPVKLLRRAYVVQLGRQRYLVELVTFPRHGPTAKRRIRIVALRNPRRRDNVALAVRKNEKSHESFSARNARVKRIPRPAR